MGLVKKLILEDLLDLDTSTDTDQTKPETEIVAPDLNEADTDNFNLGTISDILTKDLDLFNHIKAIIEDPNIKEEIRQILSSVIDDLAITIGKLQEGIKIATDSHNEDLITQGQEDIKNITLEGTKEE